MSEQEPVAAPDDSQPESIEAPAESDGEQPRDHHDSCHPEVDPAIAEAVDGVTNRFGVQGLEQLMVYAEHSLADARAALDELAEG